MENQYLPTKNIDLTTSDVNQDLNKQFLIGNTFQKLTFLPQYISSRIKAYHEDINWKAYVENTVIDLKDTLDGTPSTTETLEGILLYGEQSKNLLSALAFANLDFVPKKVIIKTGSKESIEYSEGKVIVGVCADYQWK
jgi:hypothetical protein